MADRNLKWRDQNDREVKSELGSRRLDTVCMGLLHRFDATAFVGLGRLLDDSRLGMATGIRFWRRLDNGRLCANRCHEAILHRQAEITADRTGGSNGGRHHDEHGESQFSRDGCKDSELHRWIPKRL